MERRITQRVSPKMKKRKVAWLGVALVSLVFSTGWSQTPPPPDFVPGELVLTARPGVLLEKVREIASLANAEVKPIPVPDTYLLRLRGQEGRSVEQIKQSTLQAVESLRSKSEVLYIRPNWLYKPAETTPNDPLYYLQWALPMLNMPKAWDIEKEKDAIRIAVIDTHFLINHPDLTGRFDLNLSRDFTVDPPDNDPSPPAGVLDSHGTAVSSVIIASTDNGEGMAGLCWEGVQVVAMRTVESDERGLPYANILKAYRHVLDNVDKIHVVNMSYGILGYADPQEQAMLREMSDRGVILVAAAGNHGNSLPSYPAAHPFVLSIGALGPNKTKASYSATGDPNLGSKIDFAAPGGDILTRWEEGIVAASPKSSGWGVITEGYEFVQGTSFASPYAAAAIGLMLSADIDKADIVPILQETADPLGKVPPSSEYGYGLINVFAALTGSGISVAIENPTKGKVFEVLKVPVRAIIKARLQGGAQPEITLKLDGEVIPPEKWQKCLTTVNERTKRFDMVLRFPPPPLGEISQQHTLEVIATAQDSQGKTIQSRDSSNFTIQVHQQL
ncbi:MAG: S8 family serine peptidase, partial [candidate division WOR-3 bacterium]